ncbi:MAG: DEDD exonuclease domain-containing protein [Acidimicrobiales bacterium]|nr:DEDD exonuclease domain-containing protein [Acidimicrobiales bacterium]
MDSGTLFNQPSFDQSSFDQVLFGRPAAERVVTHRASPRTHSPGSQRSFDDLGVPLHQVTFCVIDLETTGGNRNDDRITEIGAVKVCGGEALGTFQTMVNPGIRIPAEITVLTGITQAMVLRAPRIESVLPSLLEFIGDSVVVGHNVGFDLAFINSALERSGRQRLGNHVVDTLAIARRLLVDEVPNMKLGTLADRLRLDHRPTHRALDDAMATADLLHFLFERAAFFGVLGLDDLLNLPGIDTHPQVHKLALTDGLPRRPGVYMFHDRDGRILYVGKATNLRSRVRSYFSSDRRRKVAQLLRETDHISHIECPGPLEPEVTEIRLIQQHSPRFNRVGKSPSKYVYLKLTLNEQFPRLSVVTRPKSDGALYLGPVRSRRAATAAIDAIHSVTSLRRCTSRPSSRSESGPCATAQLGASACPCTGFTPLNQYAQITAQVTTELTQHPERLLGRLADRMHALALAERFEEAAETRDRAAALAAILRRSHLFARMQRAGRLVVEQPGRGGAEIVAGRLVNTWSTDGDVPLFSPTDIGAPGPEPAGPFGPVLDGSAADEIICVASWLDSNAADLRLLQVEGQWSSATISLPRFAAAKGVGTKRDT